VTSDLSSERRSRRGGEVNRPSQVTRSSSRHVHGRGPPQSFICDWIEQKEFDSTRLSSETCRGRSIPSFCKTEKSTWHSLKERINSYSRVKPPAVRGLEFKPKCNLAYGSQGWVIWQEDGDLNSFYMTGAHPRKDSRFIANSWGDALLLFFFSRPIPIGGFLSLSSVLHHV